MCLEHGYTAIAFYRSTFFNCMLQIPLEFYDSGNSYCSFCALYNRNSRYFKIFLLLQVVSAQPWQSVAGDKRNFSSVNFFFFLEKYR